MSSTINHVRLSDCGLLIEIETYEEGRLTGAVLIDRSVWPSIISNVERCITERQLLAQAENIVDAMIYGDDP